MDVGGAAVSSTLLGAMSLGSLDRKMVLDPEIWLCVYP